MAGSSLLLKRKRERERERERERVYFHLYEFEYSLPKNAFMSCLIEIGRVVLEKIF